ncbi:28S ribosomal protein S29, mitochondrial [Gryllus bimaculatus]|nr:28S ribosomal protein S29, mitochondrial [Gryllus bimaculatus]
MRLIATVRCLRNSGQLNHNLEHEGRFYVVPPAVCNQLFRFGGIPKGYEVQAKTFDETCLMIRKPALEVINMMKVADYSRPIVKYVLLPDWMKKCKDHTRSETREGFRDTPLDSAAWLAHFKTQNQHLLSQTDLTVTSNYTWSKREETRSGSPLLELVDLGINRIKYASNIIVALASEVKALSSSGRCKTLVAIDGFNCFYNKRTMIKDENWKIVPPFQLTVTEAFINLVNYNWAFELLDPFIPVHVPCYSEKEFHSCMDYYMERSWIQNENGNTEEGRSELMYLSTMNPYQLMKICGPL